MPRRSCGSRATCRSRPPARLVAGRHDQAVGAAAHQPTGGGADGIGRDHGKSLVHGLVDNQPPRLAKGSRRDRRHDEHVARRVHVAELLRGERAEAQGRCVAGARVGADTGEDERGVVRLEARGAPCRRPAPAGPSATGRPTNRNLVVPAKASVGRWAGRSGSPEVVVDRLRGHVDIACAACET